MRTKVLIGLFVLALVLCAVWLWGALGAVHASMAGATVSLMVALSVAFFVVAWRGRHRGRRRAMNRGVTAVVALTCIAIAVPALVAADATIEALREHSDWWVSDDTSWFAKRSRDLGGLIAGGLSPSPTGADNVLVEGSGEDTPSAAPLPLVQTPTRADVTAEEAGDAQVEVQPTPPPTSQPTNPTSQWSSVYGPFGLMRRLATPEPAFERAEAAVEDAASNAHRLVIATTIAAGGKPPMGRVDAGFRTSSARSQSASVAAISPVTPVVASDGVPLWPSPNVPHASAMTVPDSAAETMSDLAHWITLEAATPRQRMRIVHDWLALNVAPMPLAEDVVLRVPERAERVAIARAAFASRRADPVAFASLYAELLAPMGIDARVVVGGTPREVARGGAARAWNVVRLDDAWRVVDVSQAAGCVPSELCATPYRTDALFAPISATLRHRVPAPGARGVYGDIDVVALSRGPEISVSFFALGLGLVSPLSAEVVADAGAARFEIVASSTGTTRATVWDHGAATSTNCARAAQGDRVVFTCPTRGPAGGRVRLMGMPENGWVWRELAAWDVAPALP